MVVLLSYAQRGQSPPMPMVMSDQVASFCRTIWYLVCGLMFDIAELICMLILSNIAPWCDAEAQCHIDHTCFFDPRYCTCLNAGAVQIKATKDSTIFAFHLMYRNDRLLNTISSVLWQSCTRSLLQCYLSSLIVGSAGFYRLKLRAQTGTCLVDGDRWRLNNHDLGVRMRRLCQRTT